MLAVKRFVKRTPNNIGKTTELKNKKKKPSGKHRH